MRPEPFAPLVAAPESAVLLLDFDGTLAPIVDDPDAARPLPEAPRVLGRLVGRFGRVAVVSGRPVAFLRRHLPVDGLALAGLYGMERWEAGAVVVDPAAERFRDAAESAAGEAERALPGVRVERKGLATVLHWREAPDREQDAIETGERVAARHGLEARPGRMSLELRPPVAVDKGTAVELLLGSERAALYAGDDHGDLAAYDALDRLVASGRLDAGVKVAVASDEAPADLLARADERVSGPEELLEVLAQLATG